MIQQSSILLSHNALIAAWITRALMFRKRKKKMKSKEKENKKRAETESRGQFSCYTF